MRTRRSRRDHTRHSTVSVENANHDYLLVETPVSKLSQAMYWLQLSYSTWFDHRYQRSGHFFQGRYKAILVGAKGVAYVVSQYLHLNPVDVRGLGLDKATRHANRQGLGGAPTPEQVRQRLKRLRDYPWSSYRAYVGRLEVPASLND